MKKAVVYLGTQILAEVELKSVDRDGAPPRPLALNDEIIVAVVDDEHPRESPLFITGRLEKA